MDSCNVKYDIVIGLQHGDEGKGKVVNSLIKENGYTHCVRFNGGPNAGHTIIEDGEKIITHQIPTGILHGVKSIIGPNCVLHVKTFLEEAQELYRNKVDITLLKVAYNTHIIDDDYVKEDIKTDKIGSTGRGIMPAYRNKHGRTGKRAEDIPVLKEYLIDTIEELNQDDNYILFEGAQGFYLDIDWGDYPYVTSSSTMAGSVSTCGVSPRFVNKIYGVAKIYETYVGTKKFQPKFEVFNELRELGEEYGATTGRSRQCNWLDIGKLKRSIKANGITNLIINKCDVLQRLGIFKCINPELDFYSINTIIYYLSDKLNVPVKFSFSPDKI